MEETLTLVENGATLVCPCVALRLYLDLTNNAAVLDFYTQAMAALAPELKFVVAESALRPAPVTAKSLTAVPAWLDNPRPGKSYFVSFGQAKDGCGAARLQMVFESQAEAQFTPEKLERRRNNWRTLSGRDPAAGLGLSQLLVTFPPSHELAKGPKLLAWIKQLQIVRAGPLVSGSCGLALNHWGVTGDGTQLYRLQQRVAALVLQHPGLIWEALEKRGLFVFRPDADDLVPLIMRVNWLTFVGKRSVKYLGGLERLKTQFSSNAAIVVHEFAWGVIVQAGPEPQMGDLGHRDFIPAYRDVAKVLRPIRMNKIDGMGRGFSDEAAMEWLNAFDREY